MIGQRFRALGWVAGIASAATCLYLTSLQVAAERAKLEGVEASIVSARRDMRQLQTELGTRASMRQLEKWNVEVLAMAAPRADQYLHAESELASVGMRELRAAAPVGGVAPGATVMLAAAQATPVPAAAPVVIASMPVSAPPPAPVPTLQRVAFVPAANDKPNKPVPAPAKKRELLTLAKPKPKPKTEPEPMRLARAERTALTRPVASRPAAVRPVLTRVALTDINRAAALEGRRR